MVPETGLWKSRRGIYRSYRLRRLIGKALVFNCFSGERSQGNGECSASNWYIPGKGERHKACTSVGIAVKERRAEDKETLMRKPPTNEKVLHKMDSKGTKSVSVKSPRRTKRLKPRKNRTCPLPSLSRRPLRRCRSRRLLRSCRRSRYNPSRCSQSWRLQRYNRCRRPFPRQRIC